MWINFPLRGELIDPVMGSVTTETRLILDADLPLLIVDAGVLVRTQSCSDPHRKWSTELLRPVLEMGRGLLRPV